MVHNRLLVVDQMVALISHGTSLAVLGLVVDGDFHVQHINVQTWNQSGSARSGRYKYDYKGRFNHAVATASGQVVWSNWGR